MDNIINIAGLNVLYSEIYQDINPLCLILMLLVFFGVIGFFSYFYAVLWDDFNTKKKMIIGIIVLIAFFAIEIFLYHLGENKFFIYYVSFDENCNITEVVKEYKIIDNKGELYLLVDKNSKIYSEPTL